MPLQVRKVKLKRKLNCKNYVSIHTERKMEYVPFVSFKLRKSTQKQFNLCPNSTNSRTAHGLSYRL